MSCCEWGHFLPPPYLQQPLATIRAGLPFPFPTPLPHLRTRRGERRPFGSGTLVYKPAQCHVRTFWNCSPAATHHSNMHSSVSALSSSSCCQLGNLNSNRDQLAPLVAFIRVVRGFSLFQNYIHLNQFGVATCSRIKGQYLQNVTS